MQPVHPPSPDYVPGPEHPASPDYVPGPEHPPSPIEIPFVPEPEYPEYLVPSEDEAPMEDQPLPADASPVALSPGYVPDSDPEEDPKEEEEEHLAPADSSAIPIVDPVPLAEDTEAFETNESTPTPRPPQIRIPFAQTRLRRARKSVRPEPPMSASMEARIAEHAAVPTPPLPVVSSPVPLPSPLTTSPTDTGAPLGYRAAGIRMRAADASPPSLLLPTSPRTDIPKAKMPSQKRACLTTPAPGYEIGESSAAGAARQPGPTPTVDTWDEIVEAMMEIAPTTLEGVDQRVTELDTIVRQRTEEFEIRFEEAHDDRAYLGALVNTLYRDRLQHRHTALAMDREAVYARIAWTSSEERSAAIEAHTQLIQRLEYCGTLEARDPEPQDGPMRLAAAVYYQLYGSVKYYGKCYQQEEPRGQHPATTTALLQQLYGGSTPTLIDQAMLPLEIVMQAEAEMGNNRPWSCWPDPMGRKDGICFPYQQLCYYESGSVCILYSSRKCLDVVELTRKGCRTRRCLHNAMDGFEKDDNR
ncbi:hypothetical protein Tco_1095201 [Tanacetum coccineum]